ncbi:MAG: hypothetical protein ACFCUT_02505 [Kiloniellaceae bacterium]
MATRRPRGPLLLAGAIALLLPTALAAQDGAAGPAGITFFTGPNFAGPSQTLTLAPDQPYAAIPYVGDELNEKIASLRADPQVGAILFQRPHFASSDDACGPNLGTADDPRAWWLGLTADFEPPFAGDQAYETAQTADDDYSSVIVYRRELGPPPGFLLLERRSYYNRSCERSADQSYFNRIFVPVPNPPQREACTDLSVPASAHGAGADAPTFTRITEAIALLPEAFSRTYQGIDHRFILTLFDGPGCSGGSITLPSSESGRPANYRLSAFDFDRKVRSVAIRYQRGPLDRYMSETAAPAEATLTPVPAPAPDSSLSAAPSAPAAPSEPAAPREPMAAPPTPAATPEPQAAAPQEPLASPPPAAPATPPAPAPQEQPASLSPAEGGLQPAPPSAPAPQAPQVSPPPAAAGGLQPPPPSAPPQQPQQTLQPVPEPQLEPVQPAPAPSRPTGPAEETVRFPVHQVYRLNYCLADDQGCGEPAATAWCKTRGFNQATRWTQEDNIGALYPTVFIGSGSICDKFLCDGFEEITCTR